MNFNDAGQFVAENRRSGVEGIVTATLGGWGGGSNSVKKKKNVSWDFFVLWFVAEFLLILLIIAKLRTLKNDIVIGLVIYGFDWLILHYQQLMFLVELLKEIVTTNLTVILGILFSKKKFETKYNIKLLPTNLYLLFFFFFHQANSLIL